MASYAFTTSSASIGADHQRINHSAPLARVCSRALFSWLDALTDSQDLHSPRRRTRGIGELAARGKLATSGSSGRVIETLPTHKGMFSLSIFMPNRISQSRRERERFVDRRIPTESSNRSRLLRVAGNICAYLPVGSSKERALLPLTTKTRPHPAPLLRAGCRYSNRSSNTVRHQYVAEG